VGFSARIPNAEVHAENVRYGPRGSEWTISLHEERHPVRLPLIGDFNVINALGAAASGYALGLPTARIAERLSTMPQVPGRLEVVHESPTVLRDYAHTPDALDRALDAVRPFAPERLIVVFGCGGDRDKGKRREMGRVAVEKADLAIVTDDNPRSEQPAEIRRQILAAAPGALEIGDRASAIAEAVAKLGRGDVLLVAGKGHETGQTVGTTVIPFSDHDAVETALKQEAKCG
jgi:UDP-N-acetylmuramoyl-L-alanyl-D-glutamate--2,6-diaminopimelate ligase